MTTQKVAVIGNINNNHFAIVRYLRDRGINAFLLLLNDEEPNYHPSTDSYNNDYLLYTIQLSWGNYHEFINISKERIENDLKDFAFIIGVGTVPAFCHKANIKLDLIIPCGGDIFNYPFLLKLLTPKRLFSVFKRKKMKNSGAPVRIPSKNMVKSPISLLCNYYKFTQSQRAGIQNSANFLFDQTNDEFEKVIKNLKIKGKRHVLAPPMIYDKMYTNGVIETNSIPNYQKVLNIRNENDFLVLQYCRQSWKQAASWVHKKANDKLIEGFAKFVYANKNTKAHLILFDIGIDVDNTKDLIEKLKIKHLVTWLPLSYRKNIMPIIALADVVVGELENSWLTYGIVLETLLMGKPLMHCRNDELYKANYTELYSMIHASSSNEVEAGFTKLINGEIDINIEKNKIWIQDNCLHSSVNLIEKLINIKLNIIESK